MIISVSMNKKQALNHSLLLCPLVLEFKLFERQKKRETKLRNAFISITSQRQRMNYNIPVYRVGLPFDINNKE